MTSVDDIEPFVQGQSKHSEVWYKECWPVHRQNWSYGVIWSGSLEVLMLRCI